MKNVALAELRTLFAEQRHVMVSSLSSLALRVLGLASSFALGVLLARILGPKDFGVYGLVTALAALTMNIALLGTPQLAVREMAVRSAQQDWTGVRSLARTLLVATSLASVAIGVISFATAYLVRSSHPDALTLCVLGVGLSALMTVTALVAAELRGLGRMFEGQVMDICVRPIGALLLAGLVILTGYKLTASAAVLVQLAIALAAASVSLFWIHGIARRGSRAPIERGWLKAALPLGAVDILRQFDGTYGILLIGFLGSATELGLYRVALACGVLTSMPLTILHIVLAPTVSRLHRFGHADKLQRLLRLASGATTVVMLPMLLIMIFLGQWLLELAFGSVYGDAWGPLVILTLSQMVLGLFGMGPILLAMANSERHLAFVYSASVATGALFAVLTIPPFGALGAAGAQLVSAGMVGLLSARFATRKLGLNATFLSGNAR